MRILIAPDKFKGCLSAAEVARAIADGLRAAHPSVELDLCPVADGGEGTVDALVNATGGRFEMRRVTGPLTNMEVDAMFGILGDGRTAVIEMASASGLHLLPAEQRNPQRTTTYGTGQLLLEAAKLGVSGIILGIGGSATTDGGIGCAQACGVHFDPHSDSPLTGGDLSRIRGVGVSPVPQPRSTGVSPVPQSRSTGILPVPQPRSTGILPVPFSPIIVACDVTNPLYGPNGAAHVFGPQKGATRDQVRQLDDGLRHLARVLHMEDLAQMPGAGAAGGLGFGMMAFFGATLRSGIDIVVDAVRLRERLLGADLCITGEGRFDSQTLSGKTPVGVARVCRDLGVRCVALVGAVEQGVDARTAGIEKIVSIGEGLLPQDSMRRARELLAAAAARLT